MTHISFYNCRYECTAIINDLKTNRKVKLEYNNDIFYPQSLVSDDEYNLDISSERHHLHQSVLNLFFMWIYPRMIVTIPEIAQNNFKILDEYLKNKNNHSSRTEPYGIGYFCKPEDNPNVYCRYINNFVYRDHTYMFSKEKQIPTDDSILEYPFVDVIIDFYKKESSK